MKKYLPHIDLVTLAASVVGILLRFWLAAVGVDEKGLYPANHISWILLILLTVCLLAALFLLAMHAGKNRFYNDNYPASLPGALGFAAGSAGLIVTAVRHFLTKGIRLYTVAGVLGILAAAALLLGGWCRYKGKKPHFIVFALPCAYLGVRLFCMGHAWGDEPELCRFLIAFFATAACVLATYQLWAFSVDLGKRTSSMLWSLMAVYLCLVSVPGDGDAVFYLTMAVWLFLNLCPKKAPLHLVPAVDVPEEAPAAQPPVEEAPVPEETAPAAAEPSLDNEIEAIIAELRKQTEELKE